MQPAATLVSIPSASVVDRSLAPRSRAVYWRRRAVVAAGFVLLVLALTGLFGAGGAEADLQDPVAGHVVVEPGQTLWDVAAATAPGGTDTRAQLAAIIDLNGLRDSAVPAWTVVLLPVR